LHSAWHHMGSVNKLVVPNLEPLAHFFKPQLCGG
jgi:hypothetical protein